ncbi:hypothetical protein BDW71DRAFT_180774 [Aspergillus fruticulosus]
MRASSRVRASSCFSRARSRFLLTVSSSRSAASASSAAVSSSLSRSRSTLICSFCWWMYYMSTTLAMFLPFLAIPIFSADEAKFKFRDELSMMISMKN